MPLKGERGAALGFMDSDRPRVRQWSSAAQCDVARHDAATSIGKIRAQFRVEEDWVMQRNLLEETILGVTLG